MKTLVLDQNSAVYKIFHSRFHCKIPYYSSITYDEINRYGTYLNSDDQEHAYGFVDKIFTINDIVEIYKEDVTLELANPKDAVTIYEVIEEHLKMWRDYGIHFGTPYEPPIEDLKILNELATLIYNSPLYEKNKNVDREEDILDLMSVAIPLDDADTVREDEEDVMEDILKLNEVLRTHDRYGY